MNIFSLLSHSHFKAADIKALKLLSLQKFDFSFVNYHTEMMVHCILTDGGIREAESDCNASDVRSLAHPLIVSHQWKGPNRFPSPLPLAPPH